MGKKRKEAVAYGGDVCHALGFVGCQGVGPREMDEVQVILYQVALEGFEGQLSRP